MSGSLREGMRNRISKRLFVIDGQWRRQIVDRMQAQIIIRTVSHHSHLINLCLSFPLPEQERPMVDPPQHDEEDRASSSSSVA